MLAKLFGSNSRVKILKLFLMRTNDKFYIRQIARDLGLQLNSVRRELENLEKFGLLISGQEAVDKNESSIKTKEEIITKIAKDFKESLKVKKKLKKNAIINKTEKKYYSVNKDFILFDEIKALIVKSQILYEKDFVEKLYQAGKPKLLILSGFFVNDDQAVVDLFIVGRINKSKLLKLIKSLENQMGREINFTLMDVKEFNYRRNITDIFLYDILERKKIIVVDELED